MRRHAVLAAGALPLLLMAGCNTPDVHPRFQPSWQKFDPEAGEWRQTRKLLLIADCQLHNLWSKALPERNLSTKALVGTAIRPPQLDLFAGDVVQWILREGHAGADAIVHLGDALDLACTGELDEFLRTMAATKLPWVMAPGNHDFFYFGTYDPEDPQNWNDACHGAGDTLHKDRFIRLYVASLLAQADPGFAALAQGLGLEARRAEDRAALADAMPATFDWQRPDGSAGFLRRIAWKLDAERPWRSFLLQEVDASGADWTACRVIVMDSCQYQRRPVLIPNGWNAYPVKLNCGSHGEMLPDQLRLLRDWVVDAGGTETSLALACHHPFEAMAPRTKSSLGWLWREQKIGLLVTAHTHRGYYAHHDLGGPRDELELNVASTTDWPMEWRTLQGFSRRGEHALMMRSERFTLVDELKKRDGYFLPEWELPLDARDEYRMYKQGASSGGVFVDYAWVHHFMPPWLWQPSIGVGQSAIDTERHVKDTLLWTYLRLLQVFPTRAGGEAKWPEGLADDAAVADRIVAAVDEAVPLEDKVALLQQLELWERTRTSSDDAARARFRLSQAAWASRFENSQGRRLSVEDELIRIDAR